MFPTPHAETFSAAPVYAAGEAESVLLCVVVAAPGVTVAVELKFADAVGVVEATPVELFVHGAEPDGWTCKERRS